MTVCYAPNGVVSHKRGVGRPSNESLNFYFEELQSIPSGAFAGESPTPQCQIGVDTKIHVHEISSRTVLKPETTCCPQRFETAEFSDGGTPRLQKMLEFFNKQVSTINHFPSSEKQKAPSILRQTPRVTPLFYLNY